MNVALGRGPWQAAGLDATYSAAPWYASEQQTATLDAAVITAQRQPAPMSAGKRHVRPYLFSSDDSPTVLANQGGRFARSWECRPVLPGREPGRSSGRIASARG